MDNTCGLPPDAVVVDSPGTQAFEIVYGDDWRVAVEAANDGWFLLVATGDTDPDISTVKILSVSDTHPVAIVRVTASPAIGTVLHGRAAGKIFTDNAALYASAITEPREFPDTALMTLQLLDAPAGDYTFGVRVDASVNGVSFAMDFMLHHVDTTITYFSPETVKRQPVYH